MLSYNIENLLTDLEFKELQEICYQSVKNFTKFDYAPGYGRYGAFLELPEKFKNIFISHAKKHFNLSDLDITYCQIVKYQIVDGSIPYLSPHLDKLPATHIIDICIDTTLNDWGLLVEDVLFIDKPNSAIFLYGEQELHSRPRYTSLDENDYSIQLFINFAPSDFWFFQGDYKKALKYLRASPVMYENKDKTINITQK